MTHDEILAMFRQKAATMPEQGPLQSDLIMELARLLADSRGRLSKENFETLLDIGAALYKEGHKQFHARSDLNSIMTRSQKDK